MCPLGASPPEILNCEADNFCQPCHLESLRSSRCGHSPYVLRHGRSALMQACASPPCRRPHGSLNNKTTLYLLFLRKEVIQPHLPIRLPCYDFTPVTGSTFDSSLQAVITVITLRPTLVSALYCCVSSSLHSTCYARHHFLALARISCAWNFVYHSDNHLVGSLASGISDSHGVTGGVYKTRERIHRDILIRDY